MKIQKITVMLAALGAVAMVTSANATLIINSSTSYIGTLANGPTGASDVAGALSVTPASVGALLYKINSDGSEAGSLAASYSTLPSSWNSSSSFPIVISYLSGQIASPATYLLVKDGNLGSFIFNLGSTGVNALSWNGTEDIAVYNLFAGGGKQDPSGTSHIEFFGTAGDKTGDNPPPSIPEPSTVIAGALLLLPFGVSTLRILRKKTAV